MSNPTTPHDTAPDDTAIEDAYLYLLGRALVVRQERMDLAADGFAYNRISYNPLGSADFVNPNFDVAYAEAWFAVDADHAVILEVPRVEGRYYTAQILDEWGEVIVNINERVTPLTPSGRFALVAPGSTVRVPHANRVELHSNKAKLLLRVELKDDPTGAEQLQRAFTASADPGIDIAPPVELPMFDNVSLLGVEIFDATFDLVSSALDVSPNAASMQLLAQQLAALAARSPEFRDRADRLIRDRIVPAFREYAFTRIAPYVNEWLGGADLGNYGTDYRRRTAVNLIGIWANTGAEVVYYVATTDAAGAPLDGSRSYRIDFPADELPEQLTDGYWSLILVGLPDLRVMPNPLDRFNVNNHSGLGRNADGSLTLTAGAVPVAGVPEQNWLPTTAGRPFSLTFRLYVPKARVLGEGWAPPPVLAAP